MESLIVIFFSIKDCVKIADGNSVLVNPMWIFGASSCQLMLLCQALWCYMYQQFCKLTRESRAFKKHYHSFYDEKLFKTVANLKKYHEQCIYDLEK